MGLGCGENKLCILAFRMERGTAFYDSRSIHTKRKDRKAPPADHQHLASTQHLLIDLLTRPDVNEFKTGVQYGSVNTLALLYMFILVRTPFLL